MTIQPGTHVRVTRTRDGKTHFVKTGTIAEVCLPHGFRFKDDEGGSRFMASCEQVATMPGWTQVIEPL